MIKKPMIFIFLAILVFIGACSQAKPGDMVLIQGGIFMNIKSTHYGKGMILADFYIGRYEVTQKEWVEIMGMNPSQFKGDNQPVEMVSWYDSIEYCNKKSAHERLQPYYNLDQKNKDPHNVNEYDDIKWTVTINEGANGYRLPTQAEWEYAAGGGQLSKSFTYSGSDKVDEAAWYWKNSGDKALDGFWNYQMIEANHNKSKPVGGKAPNELGLYDLSGNVREWCWDWHERSSETDRQGRVQMGGGWLGADHVCASSFQGNFEANGIGPDQGLRLCRSK